MHGRRTRARAREEAFHDVETGVLSITRHEGCPLRSAANAPINAPDVF